MDNATFWCANRSVSSRSTVLLMLLLAGAVASAPASAATTVGSTDAAYEACLSNALVTDIGDVIPADGTITSFAYKSYSPGSQIDFLLLRPTGIDSYEVVGRSGVQATSLSGGTVETFGLSTPMAARAGDLLGFYAQATIFCASPNDGHGPDDVRFNTSTGDPATGSVVSIAGACAGGCYGHANVSAQLVTAGACFGVEKTALTAVATVNGTAYVSPGVTTTYNPSTGRVRFTGTEGADTIIGTDAPDVIDGRSGDDTLCGGGAGDLMYGGPGDDSLDGGAGDDRIDGDSGTLDMGMGLSDTCLGGEGLTDRDLGNCETVRGLEL